jgi:hypothetical protein
MKKVDSILMGGIETFLMCSARLKPENGSMSAVINVTVGELFHSGPFLACKKEAI